MKNDLFVSVDLDEWYLGRWATGSKKSMWKDIDDVFTNVFNSNTHNKELYEPTYKILELFEELNFKSTFFITGLIADFYKDLVKDISNAGHEIACHNYYHIDYEYEKYDKVKQDLIRSKNLLEDITGKKIIGYRSPNSSIPPFLVELLEDNGFLYDSSVTPTRRIMGKFGKFTKSPLKPYIPDRKNIGTPGNSGIYELPWAIFPGVKFPAGSGIMHRIMGQQYNNIATNYSLKRGSISYYFHPYEIQNLNYLKNFNLPFKVKIFFRNMGDSYFAMLKKFLNSHSDKLINGERLYYKLKDTAK